MLMNEFDAQQVFREQLGKRIHQGKKGQTNWTSLFAVVKYRNTSHSECEKHPVTKHIELIFETFFLKRFERVLCVNDCFGVFIVIFLFVIFFFYSSFGISRLAILFSSAWCHRPPSTWCLSEPNTESPVSNRLRCSLAMDGNVKTQSQFRLSKKKYTTYVRRYLCKWKSKNRMRNMLFRSEPFHISQ